MAGTGVRSNRAFLQRAVGFLVGQAGLRQFLDIGTGIPTAHNTHEVAQSVDPTCRVVYVDNDPMVLAHARALLTSVTAPTAYVDADARDKRIVEEKTRPQRAGGGGAVLMGVLHCRCEADDENRRGRDGRRGAAPRREGEVASRAPDIKLARGEAGAGAGRRTVPLPAPSPPPTKVGPSSSLVGWPPGGGVASPPQPDRGGGRAPRRAGGGAAPSRRARRGPGARRDKKEKGGGGGGWAPSRPG